MNRVLKMIDGITLTSAQITPRYDLLQAFVNITFERLDTFNGNNSFQTVDQTWPTPLPSNFKGLDITFRLIGSQIQETLATVCTKPYNALNDDAAMRALIESKHPHLKDTTVKSYTINSTPTRSSTRGYGFFLAPGSGQLVDWITKPNGSAVNVDPDTITFNVQIALTNGKIDNKVLTCELTATDLDTKGINQTFQKISGSPTSENPPPNLAREMFDSLSVLEFSGDIKLMPVDGECDTDSVWLGDLLSLGDVAAYATMKAMVQSVTLDLDEGYTTVKFGASKMLTVGEYIELLRVTRNRVVFQDSAAKNASIQLPTTATNIGMATTVENSTGGAGFVEVHVISEKADGKGGNVTHNSRGTSSDSGGGVAARPSIIIQKDLDGLIKIDYADAEGYPIKFRWINICATLPDGTELSGKMLVLGSDMVDT